MDEQSLVIWKTLRRAWLHHVATWAIIIAVICALWVFVVARWHEAGLGNLMMTACILFCAGCASDQLSVLRHRRIDVCSVLVGAAALLLAPCLVAFGAVSGAVKLLMGKSVLPVIATGRRIPRIEHDPALGHYRIFRADGDYCDIIRAGESVDGKEYRVDLREAGGQITISTYGSLGAMVGTIR